MKCNLKLFVIDVDGTLTDGGIYYDAHGNEMKKFCTKDAAGLFVLKELGIKTMVITGRECEATLRRMAELKIDLIYQNVHDKYNFLKKYIMENRIQKEEIGYIGDDLNDLQPMKLAGWIGCPADSCYEIKKIASYVSDVRAGHGAVRDIIEYFSKKAEVWDYAIEKIYFAGT